MVKVNLIVRKAIEKGLDDGKSYRKIAEEVGVSKSTVSYEINQYRYAHWCAHDTYNPVLADFINRERAKRKNKTRRKFLQTELLHIVGKLLVKDRRSPKDISLYLKKIYPNRKDLQISHESIYKLVNDFANIKGHAYRYWYRYLPKKRKRKGFRHRSKAHKRYYGRSIHAMDTDIKKSFGIWQIDIAYIKNGYIFVAVETFSKKVMAKLVYDLKAETIQKACRFLFSRVDTIKAII